MRLSEAHYTESAYEQRKRAKTMALLHRERYESAFEPGCGFGHLTEMLADRCSQVLAADTDRETVARARHRLAAHSSVTVMQASVPDDWPDADFDLIVLAEFLYYLPRASLALLAERAADSLKPGGEVVACHWRHPIPESDFSGDIAHEILDRWCGLERCNDYRETNFLISTWRR